MTEIKTAKCNTDDFKIKEEISCSTKRIPNSDEVVGSQMLLDILAVIIYKTVKKLIEAIIDLNGCNKIHIIANDSEIKIKSSEFQQEHWLR